MRCPNCHENHKDLLECQRCRNIFCRSCEPHWDFLTSLCSSCQETEQVEAIKEADLTSKLRQWFSAKAALPVAPALRHPLPWSCLPISQQSLLLSNGMLVARFMDKRDCEWAAHCCNHYLPLATATANTYNKIRKGDAIFTGSDADVKLWMEIKGILK